MLFKVVLRLILAVALLCDWRWD